MKLSKNKKLSWKNPFQSSADIPLTDQDKLS